MLVQGKVKTIAVKRAAPPTEFHFHITGGHSFNWNEGGPVPESRFDQRQH